MSSRILALTMFRQNMLAVVDVEEDPSVHRLCAPDCVGYFEHGTLFSSEIGVIAPSAEDCRTRVERIPETSLNVRIGAASARKFL